MRNFSGYSKKAKWRVLTTNDAPMLEAALKDSETDDLKCFFSSFEKLKTEKDIKNHIYNCVMQVEFLQGGLWGILDFAEKKLLGCIYIDKVDWERDSLSLGFWLSVPARGKGLFTELLPEFVKDLLHYLKMNRVEVITALSNKKCNALLERTGFVKEGVAREYAKIGEKREDFAIYSLIFSDLPK